MRSVARRNGDLGGNRSRRGGACPRGCVCATVDTRVHMPTWPSPGRAGLGVALGRVQGLMVMVRSGHKCSVVLVKYETCIYGRRLVRTVTSNVLEWPPPS